MPRGCVSSCIRVDGTVTHKRVYEDWRGARVTHTARDAHAIVEAHALAKAHVLYM